ncbi:MAG: hypothetical protein SGJ05_11195 [bacterium]|nr:hypothetical protein [bacterium]
MKTLQNSPFLALLISPLLALMVSSCTSPLDTDTPRKVTPLTPAAKVAPVSINPTFTTATGTFKFKGGPSILVDTTVSPMAFWLDFSMEHFRDTSAGAPAPVLVEFRIRVDSFPSSGLVELLKGSRATMFSNINGTIEQASADDVANTVAMIVAEHPRVAGEKRKVTLTLSMIANKNLFIPGVRQDQVYGIIDLEI